MSELPVVDVDFTTPPPIPASGIDRANELMASGRLFRYGETASGERDVAQLESAFAELVGRRFCVAFNSCGASLAAALMAAGVEPGETVLMNAWTLAPVPGAIAHAGAQPVLVGTTPELVIDLDDLATAAEESGSRWLLLSHMRGHIVDMARLTKLVSELGITVIEDCAHTMGAAWAGQPTGTFGSVGCFSTQTFKHVNSGEGGLLVTDDPDIAARVVLLSGSYMLHAQHGAAPASEVVERHAPSTPNLSMRMSALTAAIALPQLDLLGERAHAGTQGTIGWLPGWPMCQASRCPHDSRTRDMSHRRYNSSWTTWRPSIAMGYVDPEWSKPGTELTIDIIGMSSPAIVRQEPMFDPNHERPRA